MPSEMDTRFQHWIGGSDAPSASGATFATENPTTGRAWGEFALGNAHDVDQAVTAAVDGFAVWRAMSPTRRGRLMMRWGDKIAENAERLGRLESLQNGKLANELVLQARIVPDWLYYYGGLADKVEGRVIPIDRTSVLNYTVREPIGVIGVIMPWNSPLFLAMMAIAPALAAGMVNSLDEALDLNRDIFDEAEFAHFCVQEEITEGLFRFFIDRLKVQLREQGARHDLVDAVFALEGQDDLLLIVRRVEALGKFLDTDDGKNLLAGTKRAANILRIEEKKDAASYTGAPDPALYELPEEMEKVHTGITLR